ncbi:hypothetical protein BC833DRAFT_201655 [Globomyces pollinis-pini]|nr:hypothetical protein BC833DRAFT_201655 [Globomyces pollinis-pini]
MGNMKTHEQCIPTFTYLLVHRGIRPYPCNINGCDKSFTQLGNLKSHQAKVHSQNPPNQDSNNQVILDTKVLDPIPESSLPIRKRKLQKVDLSEPKKRILTEPNKNDAVIDKQKGTETDVNSTSTGVNTDLNAVTKLNENHLYSIIEVTTDQSETN